MLYKASEEKFLELDAKGLLLGVQSTVHYEERSVLLEANDFIVIMTDGVTETRTDTGFIETELIKNILGSVKGEQAQTIADAVYNHLAEIQNCQLHDDFTIAIFKKDDEYV